MLRDEDTEADFQRFLRRVDDVTNLLQGLKSPDSAVQEKAIAETEKRLREQGASREEEEEEEESRTTVNRTLINTSGTPRVQAADADGFLAALEQDAKERAQRRRRNEQLANALKEQGNEAFRAGDFSLAIQRYSEGLQKLRDKQELYTNRAQAYLKLHEYEKAISDCEWALKCNKNCLKAYFLMGKAHLALQHFTESRQCYEKMLQIDPQKENLFKECVDEARLEEKRLMEEQRAERELQAGSEAAVSVQELLQSIQELLQSTSSPGHPIPYYTGAVRLLAAAVNSSLLRKSRSLPGCHTAELFVLPLPGTGQTFFRTNNGFSILRNEAVRGAFCAGSKSPAEVELCVSLLLLWQAACAGNEENQRLLLAQPEVGAQLPELLSCGTAQIQRETLALISLYSEHEEGRRLLGKQDLSRWLQILMAFVKCTDARADTAMNILCDLTGEERFQSQCRATFSTGVLPLFTQLLDGCPDASPAYQQCVFAVLGLMMNLLLESNGTIQEFAVPISGRCLALLSHQDGRIVTRATGVLSRVLPASPSAVEEVVKGGVVKKMLKFLKAGGQLTSSYAIKTLATCTKSSSRAQEELLKGDKRFQVLLRLLQAGDELTVGNAAFCLSQCLLLPGAASSLLGSSVVQLLLRQAGGDALRSSVQQNSAIALGRLCVAEPRHIHQLRKLNGLAILNSSMKYVHSS
ncbi:LOW QUALITY PROTEIN: tetratricopeptide repeat protein 12 [Pyrgilauda ruficollis]|uniref:LOW QUALITY PROTEIN: tetratricopeptide repeat protein 12 n=1 Tax=Pyrgilauda ruficollis TaxID=221976 RepID=UPI001B860607|nr:LOW QUALITY PROTEIN: tetratricopeptide repeat protein 12 [Pyrgilauda ruficollis]